MSDKKDDDNLFNGLSEREKKVLKERFGVDLDLPLPEDLGDQFEVTRERIRQIEEKALKKLSKRKRQIETNLKICSFCKKPHTEVKKIIETESGITICNECVNLCNNLISDDNND